MSSLAPLMEKLSKPLEALEPGARWRAEGPIGHARKCDIYRLSNDKSDLQLALKIYKSGTASEQAPQLQYRALERTEKAAVAVPILRAPTPIAFLPDDHAFVMSWQQAPRLQKKLWQYWWASGQRRQWVADAGAWLRAFHDTSCIAPGAFDSSKLIDKLTVVQSRDAATRDRLEAEPAFAAAYRVFASQAADSKNQIPHALLHGDFTPSNLLVSREGIVGIDMWGARLGPIYEDAARLLAYLAIRSPFSLSAAPLHPDGTLVRLFAKGYGRDLLDVHSREWHLVSLYQQLRRWVIYEQKHQTGQHSLATKWQLTRAKKIAMQSQTWLEHC